MCFILHFTASLQGSKVQLVPPTEKSVGKYNRLTNSEIGYPAFVAVRTADAIRKRIQNCRMIETEKKIIYELKKIKYMAINTEKKPEEAIEERVKR